MMTRSLMRMRSWMTSPQKTCAPWLPTGVACPATSPLTARRRATVMRRAPFTSTLVLEQGAVMAQRWYHNLRGSRTGAAAAQMPCDPHLVTLQAHHPWSDVHSGSSQHCSWPDTCQQRPH